MPEQTDHLIITITEPPQNPPAPRRAFPAPGTEYPFSVGDIAYATARRLGPGWNADAGYWGTTGSLWGPYTACFTLLIDVEGDLCMAYDVAASDEWPDTPQLPRGVQEFSAGLFLPEACVTDGLDHIADQLTAAVRAITGT
ncbi:MULTISPECIES: hypothetical protein [unclassified Streptomyces]|uniref:hypothetical protein n=1 Tax=unclassified Streptomyces TaxID=2593676 RepID=UPI002E0F6BC9|nr:hypothetical protein OG279_39030 [Streptomyces sp. NBC_01201]